MRGHTSGSTPNVVYTFVVLRYNCCFKDRITQRRLLSTSESVTTTIWVSPWHKINWCSLVFLDLKGDRWTVWYSIIQLQDGWPRAKCHFDHPTCPALLWEFSLMWLWHVRVRRSFHRPLDERKGIPLWVYYLVVFEFTYHVLWDD